VQGFESDAIACSTMTKDMRSDVILRNERETEDRMEHHGFSIPDNTILEALEITPLASILQIDQMTFIPPITEFHRLTKSFHFVLKRLR
jgi:hypothetical protein